MKKIDKFLVNHISMVRTIIGGIFGMLMGVLNIVLFGALTKTLNAITKHIIKILSKK